MKNQHHHSASSRNRHPRIEPLEPRLTLSANFAGFGGGGYADFGPPPPHHHFDDVGPRAAFAQWSREEFSAGRERGAEIGDRVDFSPTSMSPRNDARPQPIAALWQPSTGKVFLVFATPPEPFSEQPVLTPIGGGALRLQTPLPPNDPPVNGPPVNIKAPGDANGPLSLGALELLGAPVELTSYEVAVPMADQGATQNATAISVASTAQLIAAANPSLEVSTVEAAINEPLTARDAAYADATDTRWLEITRDEANQVQQLLAANRLPQEAISTTDNIVETSAEELRPEDFMAAEWVNDLVLLAAANSADDAELFLALSGDTPSTQTARKVGLSLSSTSPQAEPAPAATTESLAPNRTLRWCGAVLAPVLFAAALRDRVKRKALSAAER